jgi:AcrR family transcriptional regulator
MCIVPGEVDVKGGTKSRVSSKPKREREQPLSEQSILDAALELIRVHGADALGMRGLAQELGVSPMAIYYHVPNKEELLHRVVESVLAEVPTPAPSPDTWEQQMRAYALAIWKLLSTYPGLSQAILARTPVVATQRLSSYGLSVLRIAGFDQRTALLCLSTFHTYLLGVLTVQASMHRRRSRKSKSKRPRIRSPEQHQLAEQLAQLSAHEWMDSGLETMLTGIRRQLEDKKERGAARRDGRRTRTSVTRA